MIPIVIIVLFAACFSGIVWYLVSGVKVKAGWEKKAAKHLANRNVVFLNELGAVCTGSSLDEAEAVASVLEKNCLAKLYSEACGKRHHLEYFDALLQRTVYLMKYSKLK